MSLDVTDRKIVNMLLANGRTSYTDIAKAVNMKPPSVIDRIKKLESEGIIKGYTANIDYQRLGYDITAFIGLIAENTENIEELERALHSIDDSIVSCYHVTGDFTFIVHLITENTTTLADVIKKLRAVDGITKTNTILIFSAIFEHSRNV